MSSNFDISNNTLNYQIDKISMYDATLTHNDFGLCHFSKLVKLVDESLNKFFKQETTFVLNKGLEFKRIFNNISYFSEYDEGLVIGGIAN